jgi:hypothetical protein
LGRHEFLCAEVADIHVEEVILGQLRDDRQQSEQLAGDVIEQLALERRNLSLVGLDGRKMRCILLHAAGKNAPE